MSWVDAAKRCPPDDTSVLCWDGYNFCVGECHWYGLPTGRHEWCWRGEGPDECWKGPTHWMKLPDQPTKETT